MLLAQIRNHWDKGKEAAVTKAKSEDVFEIIGAVFPYPGEGRGVGDKDAALQSADCRLQAANGAHEI